MEIAKLKRYKNWKVKDGNKILPENNIFKCKEKKHES